MSQTHCQTRFLPTALLTSLALALVACGGSSTPEATNASSDASSGWGETAAPEEPAGPNCDDGTCFECGDGICPTGAYCAENAPGGPACAWLTECPGQPECACLLGVLGSSCSCEAGAGGPAVSCQ